MTIDAKVLVASASILIVNCFVSSLNAEETIRDKSPREARVAIDTRRDRLGHCHHRHARLLAAGLRGREVWRREAIAAMTRSDKGARDLRSSKATQEWHEKLLTDSFWFFISSSNLRK